MWISKLFNTRATVVDAPSISKRHRATIRLLEATMATFISPIERWADDNYAPYELDYLYSQKTDSCEIVAPLHGFEARDVYVDISRGHLIILLSHDDIPYPARQEYYCEVPLPPDVKHKGAYVEIGANFLTVHLSQKRSVFKRVVSVACRFKVAWQCS